MSHGLPAPYYCDELTTIYCGNSLRILEGLARGAADVFITDPPYSSGGLHRADRALATNTKYTLTGTILQRPEFDGDNRDQRSFLAWSSLWLGECLRIGGPGSALMAFCDWRQYPIFSDALQAGGWVWKGTGTWDKTEGCRPNKGWIRSQCEYVLMGFAGPLPIEGDCHPGVWRYPIRRDDKHHVTGKPTPLMRDLVRIRPGIVCDPFMGSGTTLVAARELGRRSIGIEISEEYCAIAVERLKQVTLPLPEAPEPAPEPEAVLPI